MEMETTDQTDPQFRKIQLLVNRYLSTRESEGAGAVSGHPDEDSISAFVEGAMSDREAGPVVSHLVACSFCRHVTAELITLDAALAENEAVAAQPATAEPTRVSEVLSGILDRIFGAAEPAVFAHGEDESRDGEEDKEPKDEK